VVSLTIDENDIRENFPVRFGVSAELDGGIGKRYIVGKGFVFLKDIAKDLDRGDHHLLLETGDLLKLLPGNPYVFAEVRNFDFAGQPEHKIRPGLAFMKLEVVFKIQLKG